MADWIPRRRQRRRARVQAGRIAARGLLWVPPGGLARENGPPRGGPFSGVGGGRRGPERQMRLPWASAPAGDSSKASQVESLLPWMPRTRSSNSWGLLLAFMAASRVILPSL